MGTEGSASEEQWYWSRKGSGDRKGPVSREQLEELAKEGELEPEDLVWREVFDDWKEAGSVEEIEELFTSPPPLPHDPSDEKAEQPPTLPKSEPDDDGKRTQKNPSVEKDSLFVRGEKDAEGNIKVSKRINTDAKGESVIREVERELRNVCEDVSRNKNGFRVSRISETFGSINRSASGDVVVLKRKGGYLLRAGIEYTTSWEFWVLIILLLTTSIGWLLPVGFYLYHKKTVRKGIEQAFEEVRVIHE
jgi:hypothetical protein